MAIDYTGITSIDTGAPDIKYTGDEGPRSPEENREVALAILGDEAGEVASQLWNGMSPSEKSEWRSIEGFIQSEDFKIILMQLQSRQQGRGGLQMASAADPMLQDEYDKYVFEMEEQGLEPMSLEDFRQQAVAGMATGGRVGLQAGGPPGVHGRETGGGYSDAERHQAQQQRTAALEASAVPRGKETISPGTGVITRPDGTVDTGGGYIHRPTGIVYDQDYIDKFINVGDKDEKELEKLARKKEKYEASQRRKRTRIENQQRKKLITLLKRRKKQDPDWKGVIPEGWEEDATLDELYGWASTQDWTGKEKYSDLEGRELNEFFEKHGYVPTSKDFPGILGAVYPEKPVTFDEIEQAFQKGKGSLYHKGADDYRVWSPDPDSKEADWLQEMKAFSPMQYANYMGMDWNPVTGEFTKRQDDGYGGVPGAMAAQPVLPVVPEDPEDPTIPGTIATGPITFADGINTAHHGILAKQYGFDDTPQGISNFLAQYPMFAADGGRAGYAGGGIADLRQGYFLGKLVKSVTKPFKGAIRSVKKIAKSPIGKIALLAGLNYAPTLFGKDTMLKGLGGMFTGGGDSMWSKMLGSMTNKPMPWILGASALGGLYTAMGDDEDEDELYKKWLADKKAADEYWIPKFDPSNFRRITSADGGKIGYNEGENDDEEDRVAAIRALSYRPGAQEGGLMDLGGMEKDYRNEGGFVPIGGQERADDVPARLSKNEFVFTADAVRNAGGGDIDKGAEIMENLMENLEQGGKVSEESQGLEGARDMFATSQRLEGVL